MIGTDPTLQLVIFRILAGLIILSVHGAIVAATAVLLGDPGPRHDGRLTAVPFSHLDLLGLGSLALSGFGWSRPVAIDAAQLRFGPWGVVLPILAGSAALLATGYLMLQLVIPLLTLLPHTSALVAVAFVRLTARICVWTALFSLLPVPPLAGAHLLAAAGIRVPASAGVVLAWALLLVSALGITRAVLLPAYDLVAPLVLGPELAR